MNISADDAKTIGAAVAPALASLAAWWKARKAEKYSKPTGNGFAASVLISLEELKRGQKRHDRKLQKLNKRLTTVENRDSASTPDPS